MTARSPWAGPVPLGWARAVSVLAVVGAGLSLAFLRDYAGWVLHRAPTALRSSDLVVIGVTVVVRAVVSLLTLRASGRAADVLGAQGRHPFALVAVAAGVTVAGYTALALAGPPPWLAAVRLGQTGCGVLGLGALVAARTRNVPATRGH